jgi:hypothetical protein
MMNLKTFAIFTFFIGCNDPVVFTQKCQKKLHAISCVHIDTNNTTIKSEISDQLQSNSSCPYTLIPSYYETTTCRSNGMAHATANTMKGYARLVIYDQENQCVIRMQTEYKEHWKDGMKRIVKALKKEGIISQ